MYIYISHAENNTTLVGMRLYWQIPTSRKMISAVYIASAANRLELELKIIRHFLLHSETKDARDAFIASEMAERTQSMKRFLAQKTDHDSLDDLVAPSVLKSQQHWLENNLHHLKEFSESRLNQMDLILRYTLFEGFLQKIVGNILWEYPELRENPVHVEMRKNNIIRYKPCKHANPDMERITWTKAAVEGVDRLPFDQWKTKKQVKDTIYLRRYFREVLKLQVADEELWPNLERLRQIRNHIIHRSMQLTISAERMKEARIYLSNFPTLMCETAAKLYPKACTEERPEEGDDGKPLYELLEDLI